ncbi:OLC1v1035887C1 [Oldenlandia corymbosa var. corymbosa]|uniref:OLC1v1035887C1 n=1 Tax=Oldenlandia corymbosa var. corymbosa TaxID=529605 RepID=A0AAV1CU33_OLDCO|nr:OLC1v1035887C1 [Oldenlandia corymbosa var. corymbosa]
MPPELNFFSHCEEYVNPMSSIVSHFRDYFDVSQILGFHSCNGLVAIAMKLNDRTEIFVYNPTTRKHKHIIPRIYAPKLLDVESLFSPQDDSPFQGLNIAFDPLRSDQYKLMYVWIEHLWIRFTIFASDTQVWTVSNCTPGDPQELIYFEKGTLWNKNLHWLSSGWYTLGFDLENGGEKEIIVPPPRGVESHFSQNIFFFRVSGKDLCVIGLKDPELLLFGVYTMEFDYSGWNLKYNLDIGPLKNLYPSLVVEEPGERCMRWFLEWNFSVLSCIVVKDNEKKPKLLVSFLEKILSFDMQEMIL